MNKEDNVLEKVLYGLTIKYRNNKDVDCIYFIPYTVRDTNIFELVIVSRKDDDQFEKEIADLNEKYSFLTDQIGGQLTIVADNFMKYSPFGMHAHERRRARDLKASTILFDRTGEYYNIANNKYNTEQEYNNIIDVDVNTIVKKLSMD